MVARNGFLTKFCIEMIIKKFLNFYFFVEKKMKMKKIELRKSWIIISMQNFVKNPFLATINATEHCPRNGNRKTDFLYKTRCFLLSCPKAMLETRCSESQLKLSFQILSATGECTLILKNGWLFSNSIAFIKIQHTT